MTFQNISVIHVYYRGEPLKVPMGRLLLKDRKIFFEYTSEFLKTGLELSPFKLPLKPGAVVCEDLLFEGLFGVFNDSLPDGWGRLLLDRKLRSLGISFHKLSPLDRLRYVGTRGMGALTYEPEIEGGCSYDSLDFDKIADEVVTFQEKDGDQFLDELLGMSGSSSGARPKITVPFEGDDWIIKFRSSCDPKDIGAIEYAYHLMAKEACLDVPEAKLFPSKKGAGYFGVKRFDRCVEKRFHMHTLSGLIHTDHRIPSLDYETIMKSTLWLTKDMQEGEKQFRAFVFNIFTHNRDDHGKNFSFLMDEKGRWRVSPAYDLTFSSGPMGEHCTTILGEGKNPSLSHLLKLAEGVGLKKTTVMDIIDAVTESVIKWPTFAQDSGVSKMSSLMIQGSLDGVAKNLRK